MSDVPYVKFSFSIDVKKGYETQQLLGVAFERDSVPPGADPVDYLRRRVIAELDRVTLRAQATPQCDKLVALPGYGPKVSEEI